MTKFTVTAVAVIYCSRDFAIEATDKQEAVAIAKNLIKEESLYDWQFDGDRIEHIEAHEED